MPSNHLILCCPFSSCLHPFPGSGSFPISQLFASGGHSIGVSALASVLPINIQDWFPIRLTGLISLLSKKLSTGSICCKSGTIFPWELTCQYSTGLGAASSFLATARSLRPKSQSGKWNHKREDQIWNSVVPEARPAFIFAADKWVFCLSLLGFYFLSLSTKRSCYKFYISVCRKQMV